MQAKLATVVEGDPKAPFSIATLNTYLIMLGCPRGVMVWGVLVV